MNHQTLSHPVLGVLAIIGSLSIPAGTVHAAAPTTKCITAATKATHATVTARMEKAIAPYASTAEALNAVKQYRENMTIAWNAMNEPYCGFGSYGIKSAIKSYAKNVERAHATFLTHVKNLAQPRTNASAAAAREELLRPTHSTSSNAGTLPAVLPGVRLGMRSPQVILLQKKLAAYFNLPADKANVSGYFGPQTEARVIMFQVQKGILSSAASPGAGFVGLRTAAELNRVD